ncbi:ABC transporter ATP-binding protein [Athalassotoga saccharophila]|uniref:ABC transporter ATP-binding protein n=1 Tax=Athalassotoga saccharophila TaxID=1441386 RepID=UPI001379EC0E|nr:ABC transporter ATP-binding protein [Athalassotoga saccharophila]BBJ28446.1 oligopeptide transport ATP-binding protein OppD [Athalassotoga saccharophila]
MKDAILTVKNLKVVFHTYRGTVHALDRINFTVLKNERFGIIGETGCGKSVTSLAIMRLIEQPGEIVEGEIVFDGKDLVKTQESILNTIRGREISMIFQEPLSSLNPVMKVGFQIGESIAKIKNTSIKSCRQEVFEALKAVDLDPTRVSNLYPHELSGGMAQRIMIAMALSSNPKLLIADEPTSALDVTIQAQIMNLLDDLVSKMNNTVILITHDLGVAAQFCDKIMIMYAGTVVEQAKTEELFDNPLHPYTKGLLKAIPKVGNRDKLTGIPGSVPDLVNPPSGCRFHPRCPYAMKICSVEKPPLTEMNPGHLVACHLYGDKNG